MPTVQLRRLARAVRVSMLAGVLARPAGMAGQERSLAQDSTLDNLHHAAGVKLAPWGTLGRVARVGEGPRPVLLLPGLGFGGEVWAEFAERHRAEFTMYLVTLPGFGGTPPLAMPADGASYSATPWTRSALEGILSLLDRERIERVTIVAHWALATQIAFRLALDHPDRVEALVVVAGPLKSYYESVPAMMTWTAAQRAEATDALGARWFRTVTRRTWDDNNFMSYDYARNPRRGLWLWREAATPSLPVWIRYLLEFYAVDLSPELARLKVPTLIVRPGFDDPEYYVEDGRNYMRNLCLDTWRGLPPGLDRIRVVTILGSRLFIMYDRPAELDRALGDFLGREAGGR